MKTIAPNILEEKEKRGSLYTQPSLQHYRNLAEKTIYTQYSLLLSPQPVLTPFAITGNMA